MELGAHLALGSDAFGAPLCGFLPQGSWVSLGTDGLAQELQVDTELAFVTLPKKPVALLPL